MKSRPFGISDLGGAEDRLRSALNLEGKVPVDLPDASNILPVIIVGDATRPGMSPARDRRFHLGYSFLASGATAAVQATTPIVVERAIITHLGAGGTGFYWQGGYFAPGAATGLTWTAPANPMLDRGRGELPPVLVSSTSVALGTQIVLGSCNLGDTRVIELGFQLMAGASWGVRGIAVGVGTGSLVLQCRTF